MTAQVKRDLLDMLFESVSTDLLPFQLVQASLLASMRPSDLQAAADRWGS